MKEIPHESREIEKISFTVCGSSSTVSQKSPNCIVIQGFSFWYFLIEGSPKLHYSNDRRTQEIAAKPLWAAQDCGRRPQCIMKIRLYSFFSDNTGVPSSTVIKDHSQRTTNFHLLNKKERCIHGKCCWKS